MMKIQPDSVEKPLRKLGKSFKRLSADPPVEDVHRLRIQARRLEAIVHALTLEDKKKTRHLLKVVTPVRKAAGEVRDMDVLVSHVLALPREHGEDSLVCLLEHLGEMRTRSARNLLDTVDARRKDARRSLKQYAKFAVKRVDAKDAAAATRELAVELSRWPALNAENIHPFRIKVKELRSMLQLDDDANAGMLKALGKVKDQIGDWHDWRELAQIARTVLNAEADASVLKLIEQTENRKLKQAVSGANAMRKRYLPWRTAVKSGFAA